MQSISIRYGTLCIDRMAVFCVCNPNSIRGGPNKGNVRINVCSEVSGTICCFDSVGIRVGCNYKFWDLLVCW